MRQLSLMTSNIFFLRGYMSTSLLTAFTTLKREIPEQRTVEITKKSMGKRKAELHTSYFRLYIPTCMSLQPQS